MRHFNTAGPVNRPDAYKIDPLKRWNTEEIMCLINEEKYFILHAPRQTGKTSCLLALQDYLNKEGKYFAVYVNFEVGQAWRHNIQKATDEFVQEILSRCRWVYKDGFPFQESITYYKSLASENSLNAMLEYLSNFIKKPIVMFIDEIDSLIGDTLLSVLRQLRSGYDKRPERFPSTIILCGVRDIKDYRIHTSQNEIITGGSAFNIKTESLRLGNFSKAEVIELYNQHTSDTGQAFTEECFDLVMDYTDGQPWLVNALAREVTYKMAENKDRSVTITPEKIELAKENLILGRQTHLDQLTDKLEEDRVRRILLPMILGTDLAPNKDDADYCIDLGIIKIQNKSLCISNQIYREIIPRVLTEESSRRQYFDEDKIVWKNPDGSINIKTLLTLFRTFWNENEEIWGSHIKGYEEAKYQLVLQAFLQRVVNGNGYIEREYASGTKRLDILVKWKYPSTVNYQKIIIELKVINKNQSYATVRNQGIEQTAGYANKHGIKEAQLLIFDKEKKQEWAADESNENEEYDGVKIEIWKFK